jgi:Rho-binding antiterminator
MTTPYVPINCSFHDVLLEKATLREYCKIQYFTEIREFLTCHALIKDVFTQAGEEFALLSTGESIRLDRLVSVNGTLAPQYTHIKDFSCDC